jgi:hypothetical protein
MAGVDRVVAQRQQQQRRKPLDAPRDVAEHVQRGVVGPVRVLDDQHRRDRRQLVQQRAEHLVLGRERACQRPARPRRGVVQRPERARGHEVVARGLQQPDTLPRARREGAHERGLADPGLTGYERGRAVAGLGLLERGEKRVERRVALQQAGCHTR